MFSHVSHHSLSALSVLLVILKLNSIFSLVYFFTDSIFMLVVDVYIFQSFNKLNEQKNEVLTYHVTTMPILTRWQNNTLLLCNVTSLYALK